jgi:hypothetical protein
VVPRAYAATGIDTDAECSLTFYIDGSNFAELTQPGVNVVVNLYKTADVDISGKYRDISGFEDLELDSVDSQTTAETWTEKAAKALEIVKAQAMSPDEKVEIQPSDTLSATVEDLSAGMYLVEAETAVSENYEYSFTPYLVALPNNYYDTTGSDDWVYEDRSEITLKAEENDRYGDLVIQKTLPVMNASLGNASFVFQIEAVKEGEKVYSDVVAMTFDQAGTDSITVEKIPAGAQVTVTEVYSGASYTASGGTERTAQIVANYDLEGTKTGTPVSVAFTNDYKNGTVGGNGVINHFENTAGEDESANWQWTQQ